ncbi:MAG: hypothetical protein IKT27_05480 [Clostridia bacterium]|nr:hypothetical protein [Clostridia bacterium]
MPHKAFLKKKSLLDRFKDSHKATGFIQSARAEHTWNNPLTRRKRTKELNGWIKSFAGKRHIHKLARFNAMQAGKNESAEYNVDCLRYGSTLELPNGVCVRVKETIRCPRRAAFIFRVLAIIEEEDGFVIHGFYPGYGLERRPSEEFDLHSDDATALVSFIENNMFNSRGESMQHKLTIKLHETKFDPSQYDFFIASYTLNGNDRSKTTNGIVDAQGTLEDAQKHGATNLKLVGVKDNDKTEIPMESLGISAHKDEAMSLKGFLEALEEKLVKQFDLDEDEVKNYLDSHTQEMQELLDDKELSLKEKVLFVRGEITGKKDESKGPTDEKLGYEKGHKNSKGEDAPWVIRSHEDNRILASFAKKKDAEEHLKRMKQYSKQESKSADEFDKYIKDVKSLLKSKYGMDFNDKDTCRLNVGWMEKLDAMFYQGKPVEDGAKEVAAFCGYNKDESKQSEANGPFDAPIKDWYMGAYKDDDLGDRLNGTFKGVLQTLLRGDDVYTYIGVGDSLIRERLFSQLAKMLDVDYDEIYNVWLNEGAASNELTAKLNKIGLKRTRTIPPTIKDKVKNLGRCVLPPKIVKVAGESKKSEANGADSPWQVKVEFEFEGEPQFTNVITYAGSEDEAKKNAIAYMQREYSDFKNYVAKEAKLLPKKTSERLFNKAEMEKIALSEASSLDNYRSDVISELVVSFHYGEDGATKLADKHSDTINDAYVEGESLPYETARLIARQDRNGYANESKKSKKSESKKSEGRLELIDTIIVPKWLWEAYNFGNEYGEDLDGHEQNILSEFQEKYSDCLLDDEGEEAYFSSDNDFDSYGGLCFTVKVYKQK